MQINQDGLGIIKTCEGLRLESYRCPAGVWTIGYGHTGPDVRHGMRIDEAEAERLLAEDVAHFERGVSRLVRVPLKGNQFSALVSFAYNVGLAALRDSTLLRKLNGGDIAGASAEFPRWNKSAGRELLGLTRRRRAERELFERPDGGMYAA